MARVSEDSPAEKAGMRRGDVIVEYRRELVTDVGSVADFQRAVKQAAADKYVLLMERKSGVCGAMWP
ncbi:PDZ domain-containing protein [Methylomarinum vadi]|uniref:PDZ domain-containing protein n=1 Tax=Methylomarinum vadi TaxID=438855 RepID=UPI0004DEF489|nr:PDZ domain-containing protein [Methylomarinum vadi]